MTGYHFTSWRNWESIKKNGLKPYPINKTELLEYFDTMPIGIWVWEYPPVNESELGSVIFQLASKGQTKIVKLAIEYENDDLLYADIDGWPKKIHLYHDGELSFEGPGWTYHKGQEAVIIIKPVPLQNIKLLKTYNLMDIVNER